MSTQKQIIKTTEPDWSKKMARAYRFREPVILVDNAKLGVDPANQSWISMAKQSGLSKAEWIAFFVSLGFGVTGIRLMIAAILDPEPTSKLGLLVSAGFTLAITGGMTAVRVLTGIKPPRINSNKIGFDISWE